MSKEKAKVFYIINNASYAKRYVTKTKAEKAADITVPLRIVTDAGILASVNYVECEDSVIQALKKGCPIFSADLAAGLITIVSELPQDLKSSAKQIEELNKKIEALQHENDNLKADDSKTYIKENDALKAKIAELEKKLSELSEKDVTDLENQG